MAITISAKFVFETSEPTDILLQFEAAEIPEQRLLSADTSLPQAKHLARIAAGDDIGERIWLRVDGKYSVDYRAEVELDRLLSPISSLDRVEPHNLPAEAVKYLFDSRYCQADRMQSFVQDEFGDLAGGARIMAMHEWIARNFTYTPGASDASTTAVDSFVERRGVCRDYAHVMVTLARASAIPARFVSCYAPHVTPQDFHAVAEVFLSDPTTPGGGAWYLIDATNMANAENIVKIGVGRDAADVSFMTSFGQSNFLSSEVSVSAS
ncbi:transglutaminase family protein [Pontixanthobacter aestiaquae]|uniref:Transglutaminase family protein n=1 Tax=Pontixanthobacter aestiaquae TaxID=1509367 RepID=A0A844Z7H1_9SPHN|nr:transglutaminase family protein [Pontixanthobacter aestiaquae]MDN3646175.1 transglutaminase family protein [Pontixanthobacter aestiaquae]MXO82833.1 transglutaminase family protein [Pontixanthobacter aestiaquae]